MRMTGTSRRIAAALIALGAAAATPACSDSSTPAGDGGASGGDTGTTADTGTPRADGGECTSAADCRTYGLHCDACTCVALPVGSVDPVCNGMPVSCLIDPCTGKTAVCTSGMCAIE
jgi:hypothetical protein